MTEQTFGARLKQLREQAGISQQDLAEKAGLHKFSVAKLERGERDPTWDTVQKLARALNANCLAFDGTVSGKGLTENPDAPPAPRGRPRKVESPGQADATKPPPEGPAPPKKGSKRKTTEG